MTDLSPEKKKKVDALLAKPLLARLATANPDTCQPHVVPLWYAWDGEALWISGFRSTRKFRELEKNPRCSIVIDYAEENQDNFGVVMEGQAEVLASPRALVVEKTTWIYLRYLGEEGVQAEDPQSWIHDPENVVARLKPEKTYSWFSS